MKVYLNNDWQFKFNYDADFDNFNSFKDVEEIRIPHTVKELSYNYCSPKEYETVAGYRRVIKYNEAYNKKRLFLHFDGVAHYAEVYLNGKLIASHKGGYTGFKVEITKNIKKRSDNYLVVKVDNRESLNIPPFGYTIDYLCYGGIYRDVYLSVENPAFIEDVYSAPVKYKDKWIIKSFIKVNGVLNGTENIDIYLKDKEGNIVQKEYVSALLDKYDFNVNSLVNEWKIDNPYLYKLEYVLNDQVYINDIAFRTIEFKADGFYLNDVKTKFVGLNRHQSYPYVGYAMPDSMQKEDVRILKEELGCNAVRTSHYPDSHAFFKACDESGLLVITELPGWQHIGDEKWKKNALNQLKEMILEFRKHPSIIVWGVRINESQDDDEFYLKTNKLAHELDPFRQTTGVRFLTGSSLLEDVYAHNDFSYDGNIDKPGLKSKKQAVVKSKSMNKGYFVSECNGHMYPTKDYDDPGHILNHALRHAKVLNSMYEQDDISGITTWCMFDYNTHKDFGSGDRICYHGVLDMFRNPKLAASVYSSQSDSLPVLEISSSMDIGDYPAGNIGSVLAFTNADSIKLYKNNQFVKEFYPSEEYKYLKHPPILIDDFIGQLIEMNEGFDLKTCNKIKECLLAVAKYGLDNIPFKYKFKLLTLMLKDKRFTMSYATELYNKYISGWGQDNSGYRFEAIKNGEVIKEVIKKPGETIKYDVKVSSNKLKEDKSYDVASINIRVVDENNNLATYFMDSIELSKTGPIEIIGTKIISLKGGQFGTYVKTTGKAGKATLTLKNPKLGNYTIRFECE